MQIRRHLVAGASACALLVAAACASGPTRTSVPAPDDWTPETVPEPLSAVTPVTSPGVELAAPTQADPVGESPPGDSPTAGPLGDGGLIASAGPVGLRLMRPSGEVVGELGADQVVTQPTWSRDGRRLAATLTDPASGTSRVAVVDIATGDIAAEATARPYFFYTWSHDGSRLLALGPSQTGGTAAYILDETGAPATDVSLQGQSLFAAWEPGGRRLLLHAGHRLMLINDVDSPRDHNDYGLVGVDFQAPAWVPGTQDFLYVDSYGQAPADAEAEELLDRRSATSPQLLRRSADTGEITDLGPAGRYTMMAVHPSGDRVAVSSASPEPSDGQGSQQSAQSDIPDGSVQIIDLATAERRTVIDQIGLWLEWSPDGRRLLVAASAGDPRAGMSWNVWDGTESVELTRFAPSVAFLSSYLPFADQYDETPRLWSPDGDAITFGANTAEGDVTVVARLDAAGAVASLGPSDVSFWSPVP